MTLEQQPGYIWLDQQWLPWSDAKLHLLSHTLHYGDGVFEGIRAYDGVNGPAIFRLDLHLKRLFQSALIIGLNVPYSVELLKQVHIELLERNNLKNAYFRPLVFTGAEKLGLHAINSSHVMVAAWDWGAYLGGDAIKKGIRVKTSSYNRHSINSVLCKAKACGNYLNSILAVREAVKSGYDEALLLDHEGYVCEGSAENIFIIRNNKIYTPDLTAVLEGITRDTVIQIARDLKIEVHEKPITRDEVYIADEAFFTGTAAEVTPICELDDRAIGSGQPGAITRLIQEKYFGMVQGKNEQYAHWLTLGRF